MNDLAHGRQARAPPQVRVRFRGVGGGSAVRCARAPDVSQRHAMVGDRSIVGRSCGMPGAIYTTLYYGMSECMPSTRRACASYVRRSRRGSRALNTMNYRCALPRSDLLNPPAWPARSTSRSSLGEISDNHSRVAGPHALRTDRTHAVSRVHARARKRWMARAWTRERHGECSVLRRTHRSYQNTTVHSMTI